MSTRLIGYLQGEEIPTVVKERVTIKDRFAVFVEESQTRQRREISRASRSTVNTDDRLAIESNRPVEKREKKVAHFR